MNSQFGFLLKVLLVSAGLSLGIKYGAPMLSIPATTANALIGVILPTLAIAIALAWRTFTTK